MVAVTATIKINSLLLSQLTGGIYLQGRGPGESFSVPVTPASLAQARLNLAAGDWRFVVMAWSGPSLLQGNVYCDVLDKSLALESESIELNLSAAKCSLPVFGGFAAVDIVSCSRTDNVLTNAADCATLPNRRGFSKGMTLELPSYIKRGDIEESPGMPSLGTSCLNLVDSPKMNERTYDLSLYNLPLGREIKMNLFTGNDCEEDTNKFHFVKGIAGDEVRFSSNVFPEVINITPSTKRYSIPGFYKVYLPDSFTAVSVLPFVNRLSSFSCGSTSCFSPSPGTSQSNSADTSNFKKIVYDIIGKPASGFINRSTMTGGDENYSALDDLREIMGANGIGGILARSGITSCSAIPAGYSETIVVDYPGGFTDTYELVFGPGQQAIPSGMSGGGNLFERQVKIYANGFIEEILEFNCTANVNVYWVRSGDNPNQVSHYNDELYNHDDELYIDLTPSAVIIEGYEVSVHKTLPYQHTKAFRLLGTPSSTTVWSNHYSKDDQGSGVQENASRAMAVFDSQYLYYYSHHVSDIVNATNTAIDTPTVFSNASEISQELCLDHVTESSVSLSFCTTPFGSLQPAAPPLIQISGGNFSVDWVKYNSACTAGSNSLNCQLTTLN